MYWRLETLLIEISLNFFFYVDQDASLMQTDEYGRIVSKKVYQFAKSIFHPEQKSSCLKPSVRTHLLM